MNQQNLKCYKLIQLEREPVICRAVIRSPAVAVARHARACPPPLGSRTGPGHQRCRPSLRPARAGPHPPRLVPPGLNLCPPHPHKESCKPPRRPPLPLPPMATTMPPTSAASKPRRTHRQRTSGYGPPSRHRRRPRRPGWGGGGVQNTAPCHSRDRAAARLGTSARSSLVIVIVVGG